MAEYLRVKFCSNCGKSFYGAKEQNQCGQCSMVDYSLKRLDNYSILDDYDHPKLWR